MVRLRAGEGPRAEGGSVVDFIDWAEHQDECTERTLCTASRR